MSCSILVVNDEPVTRYLLRLLLEKCGFTVHEAGYGMEIMHQIRTNHPDLFVFDVVDNGNRGFAIFKPVNGSETAVAPLVLLSQSTQWSLFSKLLNGTFAHFLPQPLTDLAFNHTLQTLMVNT